MLINLHELPDAARQPLLLALQFQVAASIAQTQDRISVLTDAGLPDQYKGYVAKALEARLISSNIGWPGNDPTGVYKAARILWALGLMQMQRLIAAGEWFPSSVDPMVFPDTNELLKHGAAKSRLV